MVDVVNDVIINYKSVGLDKVGRDIKQASVALDGLVVSATSSEKATASLENRFKSLERTFGTSQGSADKFAKVQDQVNKAVAQNPELQGRANEVLAAAAAKYGMVGKAVQATGESSKLARHEMINLSRQIQDVGVSLFSGQSPLTVLFQQGSQIADVFASSEATVGGAFRQMGAAAARFITPVTATVTAVVGLTAAAAALAAQWDKVQTASQRALIGAGERTGTTVSDLNRFTTHNSGLSGTGLSNKEARQLGEDFTKTGEIVVGRLHDMSDAVVGFANQTGKSVSEAGKAMVGFAQDPKRALSELSKTFGDFDIGTRKAVDALVEADDKTGAFNVIIDALAEKSKKAAENMGFFEKAARSIVNVFATETVKPSGLEDQFAAAQARAVAAQEQLATAARQGAPTAVLDALGEHLARARQEVDQFQAAVDKVNAERAAAEINKLSTAADGAVQAIIPQLAQIEQLRIKLEELERAKAAGTTSKFGAEVDNAALVALQNQVAALREGQAEAARYGERVAEISKSWGSVGQSTALALQSMQNSLPVAQAWTESARMLAQYQATYNSLIDQGKTSEEAAALAAKQYELSKAAAVASAQKLVQSSQDNLDMIRAQGNGMEAVTAAAIAYRDAIQAGATATQAAAISANTLAANMLRAAQAAGQLQYQTDLASINALNAAVLAGAQSSGKQYTSTGGSPKLNDMLRAQALQQSSGVQGAADAAYATGGASAALSAIENSSTASASYPNKGGYDLNSLLGSNQSSVSDKISAYDNIVQLQNAQTTDRATQVSNLERELTWLQTLPASIARDQKIAALMRSIDDLKKATDANTAATLNPLYSQGHGALAIGYYHAASGLDLMAQGPTFGDQVPFHAMVNGGERIQITPAGQRSNSPISGNDIPSNFPAWARELLLNAMRSQKTVVQNFDFRGVNTSNSRRSRMQYAQGFGQTAAAMK